MTANADRNVCILINNAKPFEDETDGKEHSESQNKQQVLGSNPNDRPVNLSAQVQDVNKTCGLVYVFKLFCFTFHTGFWVMIRAKRKAGRTTNKLLTLTLTCTLCFSWRQVRRLRIITLRKLSPWLSVLECKHAESTNNCREKKRLLSIGRYAEEILNSYTHCKYKLLNGSRTT